MPTARRVAKDKAADPSLLEKALLVLGHHGAKEIDLPIMREFRDDKRSTKQIIRPNGEQEKSMYEVRDTAAAMSSAVSTRMI